MKIFSLAALAIACIVAGNARAAEIALYVFDADTGVTTDAEANTTASSIAFGAGISAGAEFTSNEIQVGGDDTNTVFDNSTLAIALASDDYAGFTITIPSTHIVDLSSLVFDYNITNNFDFALYVFSDKVGFDEGDELYTNGPIDNDNTDFAFPAESLDLSGAAFQNLTNETVEFRYYIQTNSGSDTRTMHLDNIKLNGTVTPVPEPSSFALAGLSLVGLIGSTSRRKLFRRTSKG